MQDFFIKNESNSDILMKAQTNIFTEIFVTFMCAVRK